MDNHWSRVWTETATITNGIEILQEDIRVLRDAKVWPVGVVEVHDHTRFIILERKW